MEYLSSFDNAIMLKELGLWFIRLNVDSEYAEITDIHVETGNYYSVIIGENNQMIIFPVSNDLSLFASAKDFDALVRKIPSSDNVTIELSYYMNNFINGSFASYYWKMVIDQFNEDISFMKRLSSQITKTYCIVLVDDKNFYEGKYNEGSENEVNYRRYRNAPFWNRIGNFDNYRFYIKKFVKNKEI